MIQAVVLLICIGAAITAFFSVLWGWVILVLPSSFLILTLFVVRRQRKWKHVPELSEAANQMLQKFGHYYLSPFAGTDFSASSTTVSFAAIAIAIIGVFKGFWWGIGIGAIHFFLMGFVARAFNPTNFLTDPLEQMAHEEVITWIMKKRREFETERQEEISE